MQISWQSCQQFFGWGATINGLHAVPAHIFCKLSASNLVKDAILAEGARALSVTLSGGALFASWKLLQFPSSLIVKVILAIFRRASAQHVVFAKYVPAWNCVASLACSPMTCKICACTSKKSKLERRLYLHRIIFIVIDTSTSYKVAHLYDCDDMAVYNLYSLRTILFFVRLCKAWKTILFLLGGLGVGFLWVRVDGQNSTRRCTTPQQNPARWTDNLRTWLNRPL